MHEVASVKFKQHYMAMLKCRKYRSPTWIQLVRVNVIRNGQLIHH